MSAICRTLAIGRASAYRRLEPRGTHYRRRDDALVHAQLKQVLRDRGSYGYRRARVMVNRTFATGYNGKRIQRVMRITGLALPIHRRRRNGRAHRGLIRRKGSNERWCSDVMEIACWNGEVIKLVFALDCCDREVPAFLAHARPMTGEDIRRLMRKAVFARFGTEKPLMPIQWLTDNEGIYTALETVIQAERLNLTPITTPVASPESNGMAEAFVHTMRRDYLDGADLATAARVLEQIPGWIEDYNTVAPHSALGYQTPVQYRQKEDTKEDTGCLTK